MGNADQLVAQAYTAATVPVRPDLVAAHQATWSRLGSAGTWFTGAERVAIAVDARAALADPDPLPPWAPVEQVVDRLGTASPVPAAVRAATYRLTRHAATLTEEWYRRVLDGGGITPEHWVELTGVVVSVVVVDTLARLIGAPLPELPEPLPGTPTRERPPAKPARHHWVPVVHNEDAHGDYAGYYGPDKPVVPPVRRALSLVPAEHRNLEELAAAQYIPMDEMVDQNWTRGTLDRRQTELVAARLSALRECFY